MFNITFSYNGSNVVRTVNCIPRIGETVHIRIDDAEFRTLKVLSVEHSEIKSHPMSIVVRLVKGNK